jgi:hypothetical protein
MPNVNIASLTPALKELYEGKIVKAVNDETVLTQRIESTNKGVVQKAGGKYVDFPVQVGRNQGISYRQENETLGDVGRARLKEVNVSLFYGYGRARFQGQIFEIAETDRQSFVNAVDNEMQVLEDSIKKDQNRIYYGDGTGMLAAVAVTMGGAGNTFTVDDARWIEIDALVDVTTSAGTDLAVTRTVTAVDYDTKAVTLSGATFTATTSHRVVRAGNFLGGQQREPTGLARIADNTVNLYGLNDPKWKARVINNGGNALSETSIIKLLDDIRIDTGNTPTVLFTSLGVRRAYFNLLIQQRRFTGTMEFNGGFKGLPFSYGSKDVPIVEDPDCPAGRIYAVPERLMRVYHTKDWHFEDKTGSMFTQVSNVDAFDVMMKRYFELGIRQRNALGALINVAEN